MSDSLARRFSSRMRAYSVVKGFAKSQRNAKDCSPTFAQFVREPADILLDFKSADQA